MRRLVEPQTTREVREAAQGIGRKPLRRATAIGLRLCTIGLLAASTGCGYSGEPLHSKSVRTVYVDMFQSKEFRRGIEFQLTEALRKQIDRATPYKNAPREKADSILSGEILEWQENTLGRDFLANMPRETAASLVIRFRWQDMRTGKLLLDKPRFLTTVTYVRPVEETPYMAEQDAVNKLARRIVDSMETSW